MAALSSMSAWRLCIVRKQSGRPVIATSVRSSSSKSTIEHVALRSGPGSIRLPPAFSLRSPRGASMPGSTPMGVHLMSS